MKDKIINFIKDKWIWSLYALPLLMFCTVNSQVDNDTWFLLNNGRYVFYHGIPHTDPFTIHEGLHYVMQQWLSSLSFFTIYKFFGKYGLLSLSIILTIITAILVYKISYLITKNKKVSLLINIFTILISTRFLVLRPQAITYIILLLETYLLELYVQKNNNNYLIPLPFLSLLLINCHMTMWYLQFIFLLPFIANSFNIKKVTIDKVRLKPLIIVALIMFLVGFINPYHHEAITFTFKAYGTKEINEIIDEMKPPSIADNYIWTINILLLFLTILILIINKKATLDIRFFCFLFGLFFLSALHVKTCAYFALWYSYIFSYLIKDIKLKIKIDNIHLLKIIEELKIEISLLSPILIVLLIVVLFSNFSLTHPYLDRTINYLENNYNKKDVVLFIDYNNGGYTEFRGFKSYIDPRAELFFKKANGKKDIFLELYSMEYYVDDFDFESFLKEYNFTHILVAKNLGLYYYLENNPNYTLEDEIYEYDNGKTPFMKLYVRKDISIVYKEKTLSK